MLQRDNQITQLGTEKDRKEHVSVVISHKKKKKKAPHVTVYPYDDT